MRTRTHTHMATMQVEPVSGVVPAHGHTSVSITFEPLGLSTEEMVLEFRVAEFNSKPVRWVAPASVPGCVFCSGAEFSH